MCRPNFTPQGYPDPFEIKAPPERALTTEEFDYYCEMQEKLNRWDTRASGVYIDRLKDIETPEERAQVYKDQQRYVDWSNSIEAQIKYALRAKNPPKEDLKKGQDEKQENEYLDLEQPEDVPDVHQISRSELDLMFGTGVAPTPDVPSPEKVINKKIPEILKEYRVATPFSDKNQKNKEETPPLEKPLPQREKVKKIHVSPIGGNTIPIKYSKEIGRYGGIERPTSTEAKQSQDDAVEAVRKFKEKQGVTPPKERSISLNGAPVEELAWDYHDGTVHVPTTKPKEVIPDVVINLPKKPLKQKRESTPPRRRNGPIKRQKFTAIRPFKEVVQRQMRQAQKVTTLPWPTSPKIYKRKTGDNSGNFIRTRAYMEMKKMIFLQKDCQIRGK